MGAISFSNLVVLKGEARDAFREARQEMNDYNGHRDGYSGDIQTADGFRMVRSSEHPRYGTKAFEKWEHIKLDELDKRDCLCVELTGQCLKRAKERNGYKGKKGVKAFYFFGMGAW